MTATEGANAMKPSLLARLGDLTYRRRGRVVLAWIAFLVAVLTIVPRFAGDFAVEFGTPGSESKEAADLIDTHFPESSGDGVNVVWEAPAGAREAQPRIDRFVAQATRVEGIGDVSPPRYTADGTIGLLRLEHDRPTFDVPTGSGKELIALAEQSSGEGLRIELGGGVVGEAEEGNPPELVGLLAAAVVLLIAFGSIVAAGLPLLVAIFGLGISATLIGIVALVIDTPDFAPAVAGLIGIGVGVDYALLVLTRFRTALGSAPAPAEPAPPLSGGSVEPTPLGPASAPAKPAPPLSGGSVEPTPLGGAEVRDAVVEAVSTAGRSVIVAGAIVVVSLFGLAFTGVSFLYGVAISASLAVAVVVAASVTLLPATLALAGRRVDRLRIPGLGRSLKTDGGTLATRWSRVVQKHAVIAAVAAAAVLVALAAPVLGIRWGFPDEGNNPAGSTTREAYDLASRGFGAGANGPLVVAAELPNDGLDELSRRIAATPGVAFATPPRVSEDGQLALLTVIPETAPQSSATTDLVHTLRDLSPEGVHVGGLTAAVVDQSDLLADRIPVFIGGVLLLSFVLLLVAFRAPVIALKAGVMNLLSVVAAYGVVAYAAEGGWFGSLIGVNGDTPIPPFIPVMMFAILFGLSMDYEVFLLSRIREEYLRTGNTSNAVADGLAKTARVITAAAAIMVVVFLAFVTSSMVFLKLMGVGMAAAILVDATIVRMVLVPAVMKLMGRANWWVPRWLDRILPHLDPIPPAATERSSA
jgi:putative drug exporter of the RND superfamily